MKKNKKKKLVTRKQRIKNSILIINVLINHFKVVQTKWRYYCKSK